MALIYPFRGHRYDRQIVGDLNLVVTQPYDKISQELQQEYYKRSPYNVVRITRNREKNADAGTEYGDAGAVFQQWIDQRVLIQDPSPTIYVYFQEYEIDGERKLQKGFIALLDLRHSGSAILPHERTLDEPKMDRLRLMRRTESNDDLIYMLYTDDTLAVNRILDETASASAPEIEVRDDYGATHRIWPVTETKAVKRIQDAMVPEELFIADGHHRFETSLNFMRECDAQGCRPGGPESFDKRLVTCFNSADQGTTILPTHRLIHSLPSMQTKQFLKSAERYFECSVTPSGPTLWERMKRGRDGHVFGFYPGDERRFYLLRLREEAQVDPLMLAHSEAYRRLDVSILHYLILDRFLGIDEEKLAAQTNVDYARDRDDCVRRVDLGEYQAAFFLNPTTVEQMQRIAALGERMPQKSTDFYPKLLTGLVFMKMRISRR